MNKDIHRLTDPILVSAAGHCLGYTQGLKRAYSKSLRGMECQSNRTAYEEFKLHIPFLHASREIKLNHLYSVVRKKYFMWKFTFPYAFMAQRRI